MKQKLDPLTRQASQALRLQQVRKAVITSTGRYACILLAAGNFSRETSKSQEHSELWTHNDTYQWAAFMSPA